VTRKHSSCKTARRILDELGVAYEEIDLSDDESARQKLYRETQDRTFPQIFIDGKRLGGFDDLVVAREEGRLRDLLYPSSGNA
jgi:glutaredoxin 3